MNILLSYPHSGSFWVRYIIEYITKKPTKGSLIYTPIGKMYPLGVNLKQDNFLVKRNKLLSTDHAHGNRLIFLLRSYKDVFVHEAILNGELNIEEIKNVFNKDYTLYMGLIKEYREYTGEKILIYYDDLIFNPDDTIIKILEFLDIEDYQDFMKNYEQHFRCSLGIYRRSNPFDDIKIDISKILTTDIKKHMESVMIYHDPILFAEYLAEYMEV